MKQSTQGTSAPRLMDAFRMDGEVALVTGAGAGIGRIAALVLAEAGAAIAVTDLDISSASAVADEITSTNGIARAWPLNVGSEPDIINAVSEAVKWFGRLDVLVSNAGIGLRLPAVEYSSDEWRRIFEVNVTGGFLCCREAARHMISQQGGRIIVVSSIMGLVGGGLYPNAAYNSSKGALISMARTLAAEWAPNCLRVNAIAPTFTRTNLTTSLMADSRISAQIADRTPLGRFAEPEEMAGGILYLASRASSMVTGHVLAIDGGWLAI